MTYVTDPSVQSGQTVRGGATLTKSRPLMPFDPLALLAILLGLQAKHFLFDFVFQSDWQVRHKGTYGHAGGLVHAGLHAAGTFVVMLVVLTMGVASLPLALGIAVADFALHYHIDWIKAQISRRMGLTPDRHAFWIALGADQAAHHLTYIGLIVALVVLAS